MRSWCQGRGNGSNPTTSWSGAELDCRRTNDRARWPSWKNFPRAPTARSCAAKYGSPTGKGIAGGSECKLDRNDRQKLVGGKMKKRLLQCVTAGVVFLADTFPAHSAYSAVKVARDRKNVVEGKSVAGRVA